MPSSYPQRLFGAFILLPLRKALHKPRSVLFSRLETCLEVISSALGTCL